MARLTKSVSSTHLSSAHDNAARQAALCAYRFINKRLRSCPQKQACRKSFPEGRKKFSEINLYYQKLIMLYVNRMAHFR